MVISKETYDKTMELVKKMVKLGFDMQGNAIRTPAGLVGKFYNQTTYETRYVLARRAE